MSDQQLFKLRMELDAVAFNVFLDNIKGSKLKSALRSGIRKSLMIVKRKAVSNLRAIRFKTGKLNTTKSVIFKKGGKTYTLPSFTRGIMVRVAKSGAAGNVSIFKFNKKNDKDYNLLLAMVQNAVGDRSTKGGPIRKKGHSTGSIGPHTFFVDAVNSTKEEVHNSLQKNLEEAIRKAQERFYK